jgi:ATP-binding cassette, subfamily C (CFTR/MRP), member 1
VIVLENGQVVKTGKAPSLGKVGEDLVLVSSSSADPSRSTQTDAAGDTRGSDTAVQAPTTNQLDAYSPLDQDALDAIDPKRQQGDWSVYSYYFRAAGRYEVALFLVFMIAWTVCEQFSGGFKFLEALHLLGTPPPT